MGYSTDFFGKFKFDKPLTAKEVKTLTDFASIRHVEGICPSIWCNWVPTDDGCFLIWNEAEKFYAYTEWLNYVITGFIKPWGHVLNGEVEWQGQDRNDRGLLVVKDNVVSTKKAVVTFE